MDAYDEVLSIEKKYKSTLNTLEKKSEKDFNAKNSWSFFLIADVNTLKPVKRKSTKKVYRAFIAVYADDIRLIDNIALN